MASVIGIPVAGPGGSFLLQTRTPDEVFTPEDLSPEQRQIAATVAEFAREEIEAAADAIEAKEPGMMRGLLAKAAGLGFTSVEIPEEFGGMGMDKITSTVVTDHLGCESTTRRARPPLDRRKRPAAPGSTPPSAQQESSSA